MGNTLYMVGGQTEESEWSSLTTKETLQWNIADKEWEFTENMIEARLGAAVATVEIGPDEEDGTCGLKNQQASTTTTTTTTTSTTTTTTVTTADTSSISEIPETIEDILNEIDCYISNVNGGSGTQKSLPPIDIFLNPARTEEKDAIIQHQRKTAQHYFSQLESVYPELFRLLWHSSLPCAPQPGHSSSLVRSCMLAGQAVPCANLFTKVPTDRGLCCALNSEDILKVSEYEDLVKEKQETEKVLLCLEVFNKLCTLSILFLGGKFYENGSWSWEKEWPQTSA